MQYGEKRKPDYMPNQASSQWIPQLNAGQVESGNSGSIMDLFANNEIEDTGEQSKLDDASYNTELGTALKTGLQSAQAGGGTGGALTSAGSSLAIGSLGAAAGTPLAAAGPWGLGAAGIGMLISANDKKKQEEAKREDDRIKAEMLKRNNLIALARDSANSTAKWI
jgi:hypothetical protein